MPSDFYRDDERYDHDPDCKWSGAWPPRPVGFSDCRCQRKRDELLDDEPLSLSEFLYFLLVTVVVVGLVMALMALADRCL
jgi:hypothetical protein